MRTRTFAGLALLLPLFLLSLPARGERVAVMGLRQAPGTLSAAVLREADNIVWQRVATLPGVTAVAEGQIAGQLQATYSSFQSCIQDGCMQQLGYLAGAEKVIWGFVQRTQTNGFAFQLRALSVSSPQLAGSIQGGCNSCMDAEILGQLMAADFSPLRLGGLPLQAAPLPPVQQPPPAVVQPPPVAVQPPRPPQPPPAAPPASAGTGLLSISSKPAGAEVWVGNRKVGVTPMQQVELYPGTHNFVLQLNGYTPSPLTAQVLPGKHNKVEVTLRPDHGLISIRSTPPGALVSVNGQPVGKTPITEVKVALGTYDVAVVLDGYQPERKQVVLDGSRPEELRFQLRALPPRDGTLELTSRPAGAAITIDGRPAGNSPVKIVLPGGAVVVLATLAGYEPESRRVEVVAGKTAKVTFALAREPPLHGELKVLSQPAGAQIFIDNQPVGVAPTDLKAERGTHLVRWELDGHSPVVQTVEVAGGKRQVLNAKLSKAPPP
ncbi:MAG: PEGA domain-containing protein, partial [Deltaproteobacteria bacterium]|nr:PEGA domain-containing protein [Deltaproteobacteria bacterium]